MEDKMGNNQQPYSYKGINNNPTIKLHYKHPPEKCSKTQTNPEKAAVRKENPTEQGLKH